MNEWLCTLLGILAVAMATIPIRMYFKKADETWSEHLADCFRGEDPGLT